MRKIILAGGAAVAASAALAAVLGPFYISGLGAPYGNVTRSADAASGYTSANRLALFYLPGVLTTPSRTAKAINSDYLRVVYPGNPETIADFKVTRWPSTVPLEFDSIAPGLRSPRLPMSWATDPAFTCKPGIGGSLSMSYRTGYWGSSAVQTGPNEITITGGWVDTGLVTVNRMTSYSRFCP